MSDAVNHPAHYNAHPKNVECIDIVEHLNFCRGSAIKYLWRAGLKDPVLQELRKARWYVERDAQNTSYTAPLIPKLTEACVGFPDPIVGSAVSSIANGNHKRALDLIDQLIAECPK